MIKLRLGYSPRVIMTLFAALVLRAVVCAAPWANIPSDLPADPALSQGTLSNGLRYLLLPNAEPAGRVSLRLIVSAGSLHENDDERGLAHFVEHMAFRGSRSRPHGELIAGLERMGISFGPDSAAFTNYDYTIYHLDLPDAAETTLREALRVFREYASNIEFDPADIERERGVILSEMATRDTGAARAGLRSLAFIWPTARQLARQPIGLEKQIRRFTQKQFRAFYDAWYRPERIAIIAVGTLDREKLRALIAEEFSDLAARAPARPEPPALAPLPPSQKLPPLEVYTDTAVSGFNLALTHAYPEIIINYTPESRAHYLAEILVCDMLQRRLLLLARQPGAVTGDPSLTSFQSLPGMRLTTFSIAGNLEHWDSVLSYAEQALRRARDFGFSEDELDTAKTNYANSWRQAVRSASTRHSGDLCGELVDHLINGTDFAAPETSWQTYEKLLANVTLDDCRAAFQRIWGDTPPRTFIAAHEEFSKTKRSQIEKTLAASRGTLITAPSQTQREELAYKNFGSHGRVASEKTLPDHDIRLVTFENNNLFNFKRTDFEKDYILINVRAGFGRLAQPKQKPGIDQLAACAFYSGGVGRHTISSITQILERHMLDIDFRVEDDALNFTVRCPASETPVALRLLAAYITDPAYHYNAQTLATPAIATFYSDQLSSPILCINAVVERLITGDTRFGWPDFSEPASRNMGELKVWMRPQLNESALEISIVGDIAYADALEATRATLGSLGLRSTRKFAAQFRPADATNTLPDPAITFQKIASPIIVPVPRDLKQGAFLYLWPIPEKRTTHDDRASHLLAQALTNAARTRLREELGAAYDVTASYIQHDGFDTFNYIALQAEVDKTKLDKAIVAIRECVTQFVAKTINEDEFLRAKKPFVENYDRWMRTNSYWGYTVLRDAQTNPSHIEAMQNRLADVNAITREEVNTQAAKYLRWDASYLFKTTPAKR